MRKQSPIFAARLILRQAHRNLSQRRAREKSLDRQVKHLEAKAARLSTDLRQVQAGLRRCRKEYSEANHKLWEALEESDAAERHYQTVCFAPVNTQEPADLIMQIVPDTAS